MRQSLGWFILFLFFPSPCFAEVQTKTIAYQHGDVPLEGTLAWDDARTEKQPGVLVVHEWWGLNDYARDRARQLAALGYVAFAVDMYGNGQVTTHPEQASTWAKQVQADANQWQTRALKGLAVLRSQDMVDPQRLAAIGYCFGGSTVLQLAYSGADVKGVVSFHGALPLPTDAQAQRTNAKILIASAMPIHFSTRNTFAHSAVRWIERTSTGTWSCMPARGTASPIPVPTCMG